MKTSIKLFTSILIGLFSLTAIALHAQVGINNTATYPNTSAILDLQSGNSGVNKGLLPNAVALIASNSSNPVISPATGLIVYNTAYSGTVPYNVVPGYYYWTGSNWALMLAPSAGISGQVLTSSGGGAPSWTTITPGISGSGTNNYVARWTPDGNTLGTGLIQDNGSNVGINTTPNANAILDVHQTNGSLYAIIGKNTASSGTDAGGGVFGYNTNATSGTGVIGVGNGDVAWIMTDGSGGAFTGITTGLAAQTNSTQTTSCAAVYAADSISGGNVQVDAWSSGTHYKVLGSFAGSVSCSVPDLNGNKVVLHCPETPEFYFEDYGEGKLVNGKVHISIDPVLAKNIAINEKHPLRVFVQLDGDCKGVYIANRTTTGFDVVELNGGTSNTSFEWHIVCNVKDENVGGRVNHNQDLRFEKLPLQPKTVSSTKAIPTVSTK